VSSNAKLDEKKLIFFNSFYLRKKYEKIEVDLPEKLKEFRSKLKKYIPNSVDEIEKMDDNTLKELIFFVNERIKSYEELSEYSFFFSTPDFKSEKSQKSHQKIFKDPIKSKRILMGIGQVLTEIPEKEFKMSEISKRCGLYHSEHKEFSHEDIYHLLRFVLSGNHSGGPVTKIAELLDKNTTLDRIVLWCK
jgi:glutamyl/glutaminyl-tRNA synthetase